MAEWQFSLDDDDEMRIFRADGTIDPAVCFEAIMADDNRISKGDVLMSSEGCVRVDDWVYGLSPSGNRIDVRRWRERITAIDPCDIFAPVGDDCLCDDCTTFRDLGGGKPMNRDQVAQVAADIGTSLMPDNDRWTNRFTIKSTTSKTKFYTVAQRRADGVWGCSCPSWINRRHCKHLVDILSRLAEVSVSKFTDPETKQMLLSARTAFLDLDSAFKVPSRFRSRGTFNRHIDL